MRQQGMRTDTFLSTQRATLAAYGDCVACLFLVLLPSDYLLFMLQIGRMGESSISVWLAAASQLANV